MPIKRGEIYDVDFGSRQGNEQRGVRPGLVVQNDLGNQHSPVTIVAAVTSQFRSRPYPFHVVFAADESGLELGGTVLCEQLMTVDQRRLSRHRGRLSAERMAEVDEALKYNLGLT
jgi:mRNA interferase MazF